MVRDYAQFPADENGDVLWRMAQAGDDLRMRREFTFSVIFPTEAAALDFAVHLLRNGQKVSFSPYVGSEEFPWQVEVHPVLLPTHEHITKYESLLARDASILGGRNDGWGCLQQE
jgi:hypothetical protein